MSNTPSQRLHHSFHYKIAFAAGLVGLGDWLTYSDRFVGPGLGLFALAWAVLTIISHVALRRDRRALTAAVGALLAALVLIDDPSLLAWTLFSAALTMAVLLPRTVSFDDAWRWSQRVLLTGLASPIGPWRDTARLLKRQPFRPRRAVLRLVPVLAVPLVGSAIFLALFASANPVIGDVLANIRLPAFELPSFMRLLWWIILLTLVWATLRPRHIRPPFGSFESDASAVIPGISVASVTLSLLLFNALFAVENALDVAFLWSGAALPGAMKMKDYVHRGAYPLIATALLAGLFVLIALRPGSKTATQPLIRRLVLLWTLQNVLLVASSVLRTLNYIDSYLLTELRIAALAWMGLVAVGLVLICWRMLRDKDAAWLINTNSAAALVVLIVVSIVDLGEVAAAWNVNHSREAGGHGQALDLCYMATLGSSALVPLTELAARSPASDFGDRVRWVRANVLKTTASSQSGPNWTWRNARRLKMAQSVRVLPVQPTPAGAYRACSGAILYSPALPWVAPDARTLTAPAQR